jgi:dTDP-4-amino-4,6-dideoxygalactose transaminase
MTPIGPLARQRLYTKWSGYSGLVAGFVARRLFSGEDAPLLEQAMTERTGATHAVATPMARTGIYLALRALISPGQSVVLSPYTISDVVNMVICAGGRPVFADVQSSTCNIDPDEVARLIGDDTGAVLATHFYGLACDIEAIADLCRRRGVALIEDAAQAFGTKVNGRAVGTFGDAGIFSFGMYKDVTCFRGGMVVTNRQDVRDSISGELAAAPFEDEGAVLGAMASAAVTDLVTTPWLFRPLFFRLFRFGQLHQVDALNRRFAFDRSPEIKREIPDTYLRRLTPGQARVALGHMGGADANAAIRIRSAHKYHNGLRDIDGLSLPPFRDDGSHSYFYYPVQVQNRESLVAFALRHGRDIAISHHRNCATMECFAEFAANCKNAAQVAGDIVYLPTYPGFSDIEIERTIDVLRVYFGARP